MSLSLPHNESQKPAQRAEWTIQRVSWVVWGAILVAGLAGLLGPGPLSTTEVEAPDQSISVRFNRFEHYSRPGTWELALHPRETATELRVEISAPLIHNVQVLRIEPEPKGSTLKNDTIVYTFDYDGPKSGPTPRILFHVQHEHPGNVEGTIRLADHEPVVVNQFIFP